MGWGCFFVIEQLFVVCDLVIVWVVCELQNWDCSQKEIYVEFYLKLEVIQWEYYGELEFVIFLMLVFNCYVLKQVYLIWCLEDIWVIVVLIFEKFDVESFDDLILIVVEVIKMLVFEVLIDVGEGGIDFKGVFNLVGVLCVVVQVQGVLIQCCQKVEIDFVKKVEKVVDWVVKVKGLSVDIVDVIKVQILGVVILVEGNL